MSAREEILGKLRETLDKPDLRFPPRDVQPLTPTTRMTVTTAQGDGMALAHRFGEELVKLYGSYEVVDTPTEARLVLINRLLAWMAEEEASRKGATLQSGQERSILTWNPDSLPVGGLEPALSDMGLTMVSPNELRTSEARERVRFIRFGVTGVEAAFASTGSMLMASAPKMSRSASLLPFRHVALIPLDRLYPTIEAWLIERRQTGELDEYVRSRANLVLITGPSKSADIEMNLTLGVHGPKYVHAILFGRVE